MSSPGPKPAPSGKMYKDEEIKWIKFQMSRKIDE